MRMNLRSGSTRGCESTIPLPGSQTSTGTISSSKIRRSTRLARMNSIPTMRMSLRSSSTNGCVSTVPLPVIQRSAVTATSRKSHSSARQVRTSSSRTTRITPRDSSRNGCVRSTTLPGNTMEEIREPPGGINSLPNEMLLHIFSYLDSEDLTQSSKVCERWRQLIYSDNIVWRYTQIFPSKSSYLNQFLYIVVIRN